MSQATPDDLVAGAATLAASWLAGARRPVLQQGQPGPKLTLERSLVDAFAAGEHPLVVARARLAVGEDFTAGVAPADLSADASDGTVAWTADVEVEHPDHVLWGIMKTMAAARSAGAAARAYLLVASSPYDWLMGDAAAFLPDAVGDRRALRPTPDLIRDGRVGWSAALAAHPGIRPLRAPRTLAATLLARTDLWQEDVLRVLALEAVDTESIGFDRLGWPD